MKKSTPGNRNKAAVKEITLKIERNTSLAGELVFESLCTDEKDFFENKIDDLFWENNYLRELLVILK